jgi:hypothetical protein
MKNNVGVRGMKIEKPSWDTAPDWANGLGYVISEDDPEFYECVYGEEVAKRMNKKWCWFSKPIIKSGLYDFELRPEDDSEKMYLVWIFSGLNPGKDKVGILIFVKSALSKNKIKTYHELLGPTISEVFVYTLPEYSALGKTAPEYSWHIEIQEEKYEECVNRLVKVYKKYEKEYAILSLKISNPNFEKKAPPWIVKKSREDFNNVSRNIELVRGKLVKIGLLKNVSEI